MHAGINGTAHLSTKLCHASTESGRSNSLELISRGWSKSKNSESISRSRLKMFISTKCTLDSFIPIKERCSFEKLFLFFFFFCTKITLCWEFIIFHFFYFFSLCNFLIMPILNFLSRCLNFIRYSTTVQRAISFSFILIISILLFLSKNSRFEFQFMKIVPREFQIFDLNKRYHFCFFLFL